MADILGSISKSRIKTDVIKLRLLLTKILTEFRFSEHLGKVRLQHFCLNIIYTWLCWLKGSPGMPRWSEAKPRCPRSWFIVCSTRYRLMSSEAAENWGSWDVWRSFWVLEDVAATPETATELPRPSGDPRPLLRGRIVVSGLALKAMKAALLASFSWLARWAASGLWSGSGRKVRKRRQNR